MTPEFFVWGAFRDFHSHWLFLRDGRLPGILWPDQRFGEDAFPLTALRFPG